ncbi:hypothetical protein ApDm4_2732 [Acetobacter pomorum]|nr:hypothetical protein ApDm4_2732 [Acetobacter pomorum]
MYKGPHCGVYPTHKAGALKIQGQAGCGEPAWSGPYTGGPPLCGRFALSGSRTG